MQINSNTVVSLMYALTNDKTGEAIETTDENNPLVFLYGVGAMIPDFESNLNGKKSGRHLRLFDWSCLSVWIAKRRGNCYDT